MDLPTNTDHGLTCSSIVAVHGLDTSSPKTWLAYEKDGPAEVRGRAFNWLCDDDMLPAVVPKARIWTFDYNANYHSNASVVDLLALGEMLLRNLSEVRTKVSSLRCARSIAKLKKWLCRRKYCPSL